MDHCLLCSDTEKIVDICHSEFCLTCLSKWIITHDTCPKCENIIYKDGCIIDKNSTYIPCTFDSKVPNEYFMGDDIECYQHIIACQSSNKDRIIVAREISQAKIECVDRPRLFTAYLMDKRNDYKFRCKKHNDRDNRKNRADKLHAESRDNFLPKSRK